MFQDIGKLETNIIIVKYVSTDIDRIFSLVKSFFQPGKILISVDQKLNLTAAGFNTGDFVEFLLPGFKIHRWRICDWRDRHEFERWKLDLVDCRTMYKASNRFYC